MRKIIWTSVIFLFLSVNFIQSGFAETWTVANAKLKLEKIAVTDQGLEFKVKNTKQAIESKSTCINWFVIPRAHSDFNVLAALLLTASATKKKIDVVFDSDSGECLVPVDSVVMYQ